MTGTHRAAARSLALRILLLVSFLAPPSALSAQTPHRIALVGGMLVDGLATPPLHHAAVLIEDDRIVEVGPASEVRIPPGTVVIDTSGRTMMPGLIDLHVHLSILGDGDYPRWFKWLDAHSAEYPIERIMAISAKQLLMAGVTSAVDLGGQLQPSLDVRDRIAKGEIPGPRLWVSGPWLTRHVAIFPPSYQIAVTSPAQAGAETEKLAAAGVDVIKAHAGLTREDYQAIVTAAHRHGLKVHAHVYDEEAVRNAFEAGVDVLQHVGSAGTPPYSLDSGAGHRGLGSARRADGRSPRVGVPRDGGVSRAAPGPAAEGRLPARPVPGGAGLAGALAVARVFLDHRPADVLRRPVADAVD